MAGEADTQLRTWLYTSPMMDAFRLADMGRGWEEEAGVAMEDSVGKDLSEAREASEDWRCGTGVTEVGRAEGVGWLAVGVDTQSEGGMALRDGWRSDGSWGRWTCSLDSGGPAGTSAAHACMPESPFPNQRAE